MDSRRVPALIALVGVVVAVGLFLLLKDDTADEDSVTTPPAQTSSSDGSSSGDQGKPEKEPKPDKPELASVEIRGGAPVGGVQELEFESGEEARFEVVTDAADELHFHGYDLYFDVQPGKPNELSFDADIEGLFELESHTTGELLAEISVVPD
jgi:hypothetical protein